MFRRLFGLFSGVVAAALSLAMLGAQASAQSEPGVAYVSTFQGDPTVMRGDSGEVVAAGVNAPMMVGDYLSTDSGSRAEVQLDWGHVVRVAPNSQIRFEQLSPYGNTIQLAAGSVGVGVLHNTTDYTQVQTPSITIRPDSIGFTRVYMNADGSTSISVRSGHAEILFPQGAEYLEEGSTMVVWGDPNHPSHRFVGPSGQDSFDQWNNQRDTQFAQSNAYQQAPTWMPGVYSLAGYGQWSSDPQYGNVWIPNAASGWSPYSTGQWTYEPYYGWTWVDSQPWGYAPSHYGRWYRNHRVNRWAWSPGSSHQPVQSWSPALVAFIGFGGASVGVFANVGWVPLAPGEPQHRWWGPGNSNNVTYNVTNVTNVYVNARQPGSVRWTQASSLANGRGGNYGSVPPATLKRAALARSALPVVPSAQALRYSSRTVAASAKAHQPNPQSFHAFKTTPQPPQRFAAAVKTISTAARRPVVVAPMAREAAPQQRVVAPKVQAAPQQRVVAPKVQAAPQQRVVAPKVQAAPQQRVVAPKVQAAPQQRVVAPKVQAAPQQRVVAPKVQAAPQQRVVAPKVQAAPQQRVVAPKVQAAPQQRVVAPKVQAAPQQRVVAPKASPQRKAAPKPHDSATP